MAHAVNTFYFFYFYIDEDWDLWIYYILPFVLLCANSGLVGVHIFLICKY